MPTSFPQGILSLLVVCSQVGNGMQGSWGNGVVRALPHQPCQTLHCITAQHLSLQQGLMLYSSIAGFPLVSVVSIYSPCWHMANVKVNLQTALSKD